MLLSFTHVTLRLLALLGQVTWTGIVCFRGRKWGRGATSGTRTAYSPLNGLVGCEGAGGPASIVKRSDHDIAFLRTESTCAGFWAMYCSGCAAGYCPEDGSLNPPSASKPKRNTRRTCGSRRPAVPVTEGTAAGVLCPVPCFCFACGYTCHDWTPRHKKNYEDETRHPSTGGTDGGGGC